MYVNGKKNQFFNEVGPASANLPLDVFNMFNRPVRGGEGGRTLYI